MIVFKPQHEEGVHLSHPDGAYWKVTDNVAQIIVIGPMQGSPLEYELELRYLLNGDWIIGSAEFMPSVKEEERLVALRRGIVSLMFRKRGVDEAVPPEPGWISPEEARARMVA